jgi:hypothetical protein
MLDRLKRPRRGKGTGDGSDGGEADGVEYAQAERDTPTFGRRAVPIGKEGEFESPQPAKPRAKKRKEEDFTSEPVEESPATNWRKAAPIAPGEEVKLVRVYKKAGETNTPSRLKQPPIETPPDESKLTFKREKRFYFASDAEEEEKKARAKREAEAAAQVAQQTEALLEADNVTPLGRRQPHADADMAKLEAARAEAARREAARIEADRLEAANREASRLEEERLEAAKA